MQSHLWPILRYQVKFWILCTKLPKLLRSRNVCRSYHSTGELKHPKKLKPAYRLYESSLKITFDDASILVPTVQTYFSCRWCRNSWCKSRILRRCRFHLESDAHVNLTRSLMANNTEGQRRKKSVKQHYSLFAQSQGSIFSGGCCWFVADKRRVKFLCLDRVCVMVTNEKAPLFIASQEQQGRV